MDKIKLKLSLAQLSVINEAFTSLNQPCISHRDTKVARCILDKVSKKLLKKAIDKQGEKKEFTISIEFFEAHYLEKFLLIYQFFPLGVYENNVINIVTQELNQALS